MMYDLRCKYEEPLSRIVFDFDCPKVSLFRVASNDYSFSPPINTIELNLEIMMRRPS